jgi:hypothetical protein
MLQFLLTWYEYVAIYRENGSYLMSKQIIAKIESIFLDLLRQIYFKKII